MLGIERSKYEEILCEARKIRGVEQDSDLNISELKRVVSLFKEITPFPDDPLEQLTAAISAVFRSWNTPRAIKYRDINGISDEIGTAVTIQAMVYGNMNSSSGSGVCFTRNPTTGENIAYGEYLANAQGEDVVAGIRTPLQLVDLKLTQPSAYEALLHSLNILEKHFLDMQVCRGFVCKAD